MTFRIARRPGLALLLWAVAHAGAAAREPPDVATTVNDIRARGCDGRPAAAPALQRDARLDRAAESLASGRGLKDALEAAGYRATQAAVLEASGNPASFERVLAAKGCREISEPAFRDFGVAQRGPESWIVLAAPLAAPAGGADAVGGRVLALVNEARRQKRRCGFKRFDPAPPLAGSAALQRAAASHAADMAVRGAMEHAGSDGSTPAERATRAGYAWRTIGENVASGQSTPEQVVAEWLGSPRHCANIMDADYTEMGVAVASSARGVFWAQVFGTPAP